MSMEMLHEELWVYIFEMNTHPPESEFGCLYAYRWHSVKYHSLNTTRYTSQVCRSWRNILLQLPTIWGNLINLNELAQTSQNWVEEVLRRTGSAPLSIHGQLDGACKALFAALIDEQWHRVRRLDVELLDNNDIDSRTWEIFWMRPAPNLERFLINGALPTWDHHRPLFAGSAPFLRRIHSRIFDRSYPWMSQLSSFTLSSSFKTVDALNILLRCSSRLDSVVVECTIDDNESEGWTRPIHLPNLSKLHISGPSSMALSYLSNIIPKCDCALKLRIVDSYVAEAIIDRLVQLALPYATSYFNLHRPTTLFINVSWEYLYIYPMTVRETDRNGYFGQPEFYINSIMYSTDEQMLSLKMLDILAAVNLETITDLIINIGKILWLTALSKSKLAPLRVLLSLISAQRIYMCPAGNGIELLNLLRDSAHESQSPPGEHHGEAPFHRLTDPILTPSFIGQSLSDFSLKPKVRDFLADRKDIGLIALPILRLDIR